MTVCFGSSIRCYLLSMLMYLQLNLIETELCAHAFPKCTTYSRRSVLQSYNPMVTDDTTGFSPETVS